MHDAPVLSTTPTTLRMLRAYCSSYFTVSVTLAEARMVYVDCKYHKYISEPIDPSLLSELKLLATVLGYRLTAGGLGLLIRKCDRLVTDC